MKKILNFINVVPQDAPTVKVSELSYGPGHECTVIRQGKHAFLLISDEEDAWGVIPSGTAELSAGIIVPITFQATFSSPVFDFVGVEWDKDILVMKNEPVWLEDVGYPVHFTRPAED